MLIFEEGKPIKFKYIRDFLALKYSVRKKIHNRRQYLTEADKLIVTQKQKTGNNGCST